MLDIAPVVNLLDASLALKNYSPRSVARIKTGLWKVIRGRQSVEVELHRADADHVLVMIPEFDAADRVRRLYGTVQDVTARRRLEAERAEHVRRLAELSRRVVSTQEEERRRLSVELHDRTGANLAAIRLNLTAIEDAPMGANSKGGELLREARELLADTIVSIREFCADLRPALLDYAGLVAALESSAQQFSRRTGVPVRFAHERFAARVAPEMESLLFRIAQEALTNCAKHAQANSVQVRLENSGDHCRLTVTDDGVGFDPSALGMDGHPAGQGLLNMRERAEFAGGQFSLISGPGKGTRIKVEFTLRPGNVGRGTDLAPRAAVQ
jgi:two-component system sensor histidine kinase UhpB